MSDYTTKAKVKATWLSGVDTSPLGDSAAVDAILDVVIPAASREMERFMGQSLFRATRTVRLDGSGVLGIQLPNFPIATLSSLKVHSGYDAQTKQFLAIRHSESAMLGLAADPAGSDCDASCERDAGIVNVNYATVVLQNGAEGYPLWGGRFDRDVLNVEATYSHGFETIPADVEAAAGMVAAMMVAEMALARTTMGATSVSIGSVSRSWGNRPYASLFQLWEKSVTAALGPYRIGAKAVGGGWSPQG